jgi:hypothetical protein
MATGTGKTLTAAAVIKLFLRTGNARRVLFLVDRLELEDQANKAFTFLLKNDYKSSIYKENRDDWRKAEIVVTTVQSLLFNNKYQLLFSPTDFDLVISDEAHRSIGGNARAVFEYFVGYKLGLTATPKDFLKKFDAAKPTTKDPREQERRLLLDTYRTFGCESGEPTYRYSLLDGVRDGFLINPLVVDARTEVTTQLLSDTGYAAVVISEAPEGESSSEQRFKQKSFEKKFFSQATNLLFCETHAAAWPARPHQRRVWQDAGVLRQPKPRVQSRGAIERVGRHAIPRALPVGLCGASHLAHPRRAAVHYQLHQQQPAGLGQRAARLQNQQGAGVRHRGHDDHRLRLPGFAQPGLDAPGVFAFRLCTDQRTRHPQTRLSGAVAGRVLARPSHHPAQDGLQAVRLLCQLRIL